MIIDKMVDITRRTLLKSGSVVVAGSALFFCLRTPASNYLKSVQKESETIDRDVSFACYEGTNDETLISLSSGKFSEVKEALAKRKFNLPEEAQLNLSKDNNASVLEYLSERKDLTAKAADSIMDNHSSYEQINSNIILNNIAAKISTSKIDIMIQLVEMSTHKESVLITIARRDDTPKDILDYLAKSPNSEVANTAEKNLEKQ